MLNKLKHQSDTENKFGYAQAWFSHPNPMHRYLLTCWVDENLKPGLINGKPTVRTLIYIMLNPSTATAFKFDATVSRCVNRGIRQGYNHVTIANLFAVRTKEPKIMKSYGRDAIGPDNDAVLRGLFTQRGLDGMWDQERFNYEVTYCCAWGSHGEHLYRGAEVAKMMIDAGVEPKCLSVNANGHPGHPLYAKNDTPFQDWEPTKVLGRWRAR